MPEWWLTTSPIWRIANNIVETSMTGQRVLLSKVTFVLVLLAVSPGLSPGN